ncbi:MAG: hypothetical protein ABW152_03100 [Candidatus Thiodiazotropha endolucinida]
MERVADLRTSEMTGPKGVLGRINALFTQVQLQFTATGLPGSPPPERRVIFLRNEMVAALAGEFPRL